MGVPLLSVEMRGDSDPQLSSKAQEILERRREAQKRDHSEEDLRVDSGVAMGLPSLSLTAMNAWASSEER